MVKKFVVYHTTNEEIHTVSPKEDDVLIGDLVRVAMDESLIPSDSPFNYGFDGAVFTRKSPTVIAAKEQQMLDDIEAERLMRIEADDMAAKEAKKTPGLSAGVINALTKKEKK